VTAAVVALAVAVVLLAVLVAGLLRSHAEILRALHELGAGLELDRAGGPVDVTIDGVRPPRRGSARATTAETADAVTGESLSGEAVALSLTSGRDTLLAFLSSGCLTCAAFWEAFADESLAVPGDARLVVVTRSLEEESGSALSSRAPRHLPVVASRSAWEGFGVPGSPYFVYVDGSGRVVGEGSAATWPAVAALMGQAHADDAHRRGRLSRAGRDDAALAASGIRPGDPSL
jgi:hypothetical protein